MLFASVVFCATLAIKISSCIGLPESKDSGNPCKPASSLWVWHFALVYTAYGKRRAARELADVARRVGEVPIVVLRLVIRGAAMLIFAH